MNDVQRIEGNEKIKNIVVMVDGGMGKVVCSTGIVKALAKRFEDKRIIVVCGYPEMYDHNLHVHRVFNFNNTLNFHEDYFIERDDTYVIKTEPYLDFDYVNGKEHITKVWATQIGLEPKVYKPYIRFLDTELTMAQEYVREQTKNGKKKFALVQWVGGMVPQDKQESSFIDAQFKMHRRSLPKKKAQQLVNKLIANDMVVGTVQHENFPTMEGALQIHFPVRAVIALLKYCDYFIGIDSFMQHAAACEGVEKEGVVFWGGTDPRNLGWDLHRNITRGKVCKTPHCNRPNSHLLDRGTNGMWNCPYNEACMDFGLEEMIEEVIGIK